MERREKIDRELADLHESMDRMKLHWNAEKEAIKRIQAIKSQIEQLKLEEADAQRSGDLARAAEIRYGRLVELNGEIQKDQVRLEEAQKGERMLKEEVDAEDVAEVVANWTGIPVSKSSRRMSTNWSTWKSGSGSGLSARTKASPPFPAPCGVPVRAFRIRTGPSAPSSSSVLPASARPNWPGLWQSSCSTASRP